MHLKILFVFVEFKLSTNYMEQLNNLIGLVFDHAAVFKT